MDQHRQAIVVMNYVLGGFKLLALLGLGGLVLFSLDEPLDALGVALVSAVALGVGLLAAANLLAGWGFARDRRWARALLWCLSAPALLNVPIGTAVGGYTMWVLVRTRPQPGGESL